MAMEDLKKLAGGASAFFSRAVQYTEERLGTAEHTDLDAHFENLVDRADKTKAQTEKLLKLAETLLHPDPTQRAEDFVYEKLEKTAGIEKKRKDRLANASALGGAMLEASAAFGPGSSYGHALLKVGQVEQKIGQCEKDFVAKAYKEYLTPLTAFLEGDMKTIARERRTLEMKRLDLDAAKSKLKRVKNDKHRMEAEAELRSAQSEFDRQAEVTKLLLEGVTSAHAHHTRCLTDFVDAQATYYASCHQHMLELQRQLGSNLVVGVNSMQQAPQLYAPPSLLRDPAVPANGGFASLCVEPATQRAKVLYDYDASSPAELSLSSDEIIEVWPTEDSEWMMGRRGSQQGRIPMTYIEILRH